MKQTKEERRLAHNNNNKEWRDKNLDKVRAWNKKYYDNNIEKIKANKKKTKKKKKCVDCGNECCLLRCRECHHKKIKEESLTKEEIKIRIKKWRDRNKEEINKKQRRYRKKNKKYLNNMEKKYREKNKERMKINHKKWRDKNKKKCIIATRKWMEENSERAKQNGIRWAKQNREKYKGYRKKYRKNNLEKIKRYEQTPKRRFLIRLRMRVISALKKYTKEGKIKSSDEYGIDYEKIIEKLKPFPKDRSKYHLDHIRPLCSFNFINKDGTQNLEEIKKAFAPENHQWLTAEENFNKGSKYDKKI